MQMTEPYQSTIENTMQKTRKALVSEDLPGFSHGTTGYAGYSLTKVSMSVSCTMPIRRAYSDSISR